MSRYADDATISGSIVVTGSATFNDQSKDVDFIVESDGNTHMLFVDAGNDRVGVGTSSPDYTLDIAGDIGVDQYIYHNGDADTWIRFNDDDITVKAGGKAFLTLEEKSSAPHELIINDGSNNIDFIVKGNGSNEGNPLFKCDASTGRVGINGVGSPDCELHVDGDVKVVGNDPRIKIDGDTDSHPGLEFYENGTRKWIIYNNYGDDSLDFKTNSDVRMVIDQDGKVGIGTNSPSTTLEIEAAAGDIFKMENTTAYGVTYGQLVKESLTLTDGGSPLDTTLDLPARSMITDVLVTIQTTARADAHSLENVALTVGSNTFNIKGSSFPSLSLVYNPSQGIDTGTQYVLGNTDQSFPAGRATMLNSSTADIKLVYSDTNVSTEPILDVVVFYKKFDAS
jgi:hypothetical protein